MSARIDHVAEAIRLRDFAESPHPGSPEAGANYLAAAQVHATLALVEQQRVSNLLVLNRDLREVQETFDAESADWLRWDRRRKKVRTEILHGLQINELPSPELSAEERAEVKRFGLHGPEADE